MNCPKCESPTDVLDSRPTGDFQTRRRRKCRKCEHKFTTYENICDDPMATPKPRGRLVIKDCSNGTLLRLLSKRLKVAETEEAEGVQQ